MTAAAESLPHDSAYLSIAKDGDVMIVTAPVGFVPGEPIFVSATDGYLRVKQGKKLHLHVEIGEDEARQVDDAGSVVVVEVAPGETPDEDRHLVHRDVRKGA